MGPTLRDHPLPRDLYAFQLLRIITGVQIPDPVYSITASPRGFLYHHPPEAIRLKAPKIKIFKFSYWLRRTIFGTL